MNRILIIKFNPQLGPEPILQYPPSQDFPEKEVFLRIWAHYEMNSNSSIIELNEEKRFLSVVRAEKKRFIFIVLELEKEDNFSGFHESLIKMCEPLFQSINSPTLTRIIVDTYNTINEYSSLNTDQLFFNLFSDMDKLIILDYLRNGVIDKHSLGVLLKLKYGTSESSLDISINPFYHLGLIVEKNMPGIPKSLFLIKDVCCCRIPPYEVLQKVNTSDLAADKMYMSELQEFYTNYDFETFKSINHISKLLSNTTVFKSIEMLKKGKIKSKKYLDLLSQDILLFQSLKQDKIIIEIEDFVYLMCVIKFIKFTPIYLLKNLKERYKNKEISTDQFIQHVTFINNNQD